MDWIKSGTETTLEALIEKNSGYSINDLLNPLPVFPQKIPGMLAVVERIRVALAEEEQIWIFGDYDVDGVTAASILDLMVRCLGGNPVIRLPKRHSEGYGLSMEAVAECDEGLVITVDNGITAVDEIRAFVEKGVSVVILDHHLPGDVLPEAVTIVDPHIWPDDCGLPAQDYCGAGLALKLAEYASGELEGQPIPDICQGYAKAIETKLDSKFCHRVAIETVQDEVEALLIALHPITADKYSKYREERRQIRDGLMSTLNSIANPDAQNSDIMNENANIDGNTPMGTMLKFGSEAAKAHYEEKVLTPTIRKGHKSGDFHIHDLDFLSLTTTCCQIPLTKLFNGGFSTGHGSIREPNDIRTYAALAAIAIQGNQNDQHGGQSIPAFDFDMAPGVVKTFRKRYITHLVDILEIQHGERLNIEPFLKKVEDLLGKQMSISSMNDKLFLPQLNKEISKAFSMDSGFLDYDMETAHIRAMRDTKKAVHQAMESLVHNLNTMHSRAGAQVPFSSLNYGTDTSLEGRMIIEQLLLATEEGLGAGETPIFPIQIFKVKKGVNANPGDPNYDLFQLACRVSSKRLFPNFSFLDAPFNKTYYQPGRPETEVAYMGCRTRVMGNVYDPEREITYGRGNLSFTSINLPRLAIEAMKNNADRELAMNAFYNSLNERLELVVEQLLARFTIQSNKQVRNFPFLMGQGIWMDSDLLKPGDTIGEALKHGTLSIGFIGLAETLTALTGYHHGKNPASQELGLQIIVHMRAFCDEASKRTGLNFTLLATPAEGLSGRFVKLDKARYGIIPGVTDKPYYTNSFHIPVSFEISAYEKINLEAPYHALTNAGHITYIELDGDASSNIQAVEDIVRCMGEAGIGYGAINHPVDQDPACGYTGIIHDECPGCGRRESEGGPPFERIRRITGYLVGSTERWNDAKCQEEKDRVPHKTL